MPAWFDRLRSGELSARDAAFDRDEPVRAAAARMFGLSASLQRSLALDASPLVRAVLAGRSDLDSRAADALCADDDIRVLRVMAGRSDLSDGQKVRLAEIRDARVLESLGLHDAAAFLASPLRPALRNADCSANGPRGPACRRSSSDRRRPHRSAVPGRAVYPPI